MEIRYNYKYEPNYEEYFIDINYYIDISILLRLYKSLHIILNYNNKYKFLYDNSNIIDDNSQMKIYFRNKASLTLLYDSYNINITDIVNIYLIFSIQKLFNKILGKEYYINLIFTNQIVDIKYINTRRLYKNMNYII